MTDIEADQSFLESRAEQMAVGLQSNDFVTADGKPSDDDRLAHLAGLSDIEYDRQRDSIAKVMGIRSATLDKMVKGVRQKNSSTEGLDFDDVELWPHAVDPASLLSDLVTVINRFIICPDETAHAAALWIAMTWFMDVVQVAPLAVITAPEKRCGKSQLLFLLGRLVHRPLAASNITSAALFRAVDAWKPTLLVDEADAFMKDNEELRGLLNCGHTRDSAYIVRVVGDDHTPKRFNVWGAKALAGIGYLADTIMDRSIVLELRRKLPHEEVLRLRHAEPNLFDDLSSKLARLAADTREELRRFRPALPDALHDRAQDNWEPLLAIAELAGGDWPQKARHAALTLSGSSEDGGTIGNELLADIREVFESKPCAKISTADLIATLCDDDEKAWATYNRGKPITPRQIAKKLKEYGIASKNVRINFGVAKGFENEQFREAFARYLTPSLEVGLHRYRSPEASNTGDLDVAIPSLHSGNENQPATPKPLPIEGCSGVADISEGKPENAVIEIEI
jgi:putative DNA primase/helicase